MAILTRLTHFIDCKIVAHKLDSLASTYFKEKVKGIASTHAEWLIQCSHWLKLCNEHDGACSTSRWLQQAIRFQLSWITVSCMPSHNIEFQATAVSTNENVLFSHWPNFVSRNTHMLMTICSEKIAVYSNLILVSIANVVNQYKWNPLSLLCIQCWIFEILNSIRPGDLFESYTYCYLYKIA